MSNCQKRITLLKKYCLITLVVACPLIFTNKASTQDWESMPIELRAITLRRLLDQGNYKAFLITYATSKTMQQVIDSDPVLKGTLITLQKVRGSLMLLPKIASERPSFATVHAQEEAIKETTKEVLASAHEESKEDVSTYQQILNNVAPAIFRSVEKFTDDSRSKSIYLLRDFGEGIPAEYLQRFGNLLTYIMNSTKRPLNKRQEEIGFALLGLAGNLNIRPSQILLLATPYLEQFKTYPLAMDPLRSALDKIAQRPDLDPDASAYFKKMEQQPEWQRRLGTELWGKLHANPAYQ